MDLYKVANRLVLDEGSWMVEQDARGEAKIGRHVDGFAFGDNWRAFLGVVDERRIEEAAKSLQTLLGSETLDGKTFADIGCGSGLFSLAAVRLGGKRIYS